MKLKYFLFFVVSFLLGFIGIIIFMLVQKSPGKPISNIIQNVVKPTFSVESAPSQSIKGIVKDMSGDVYRQSRVATQESQIVSPIEIQQGEEIRTTQTGNLSVDFPNIAQIKLSPKTQIDFVQTLPADFVTLVSSGSAEFVKTGDAPVSIRSFHLLVRQDSGDLAISVDTDNSLVNLNILKGSITVAYNDLNLVSKVLTYGEGQKVTFNDLTRNFNF